MKAAQTPRLESYIAGADLSAKQYYAVKAGTTEGSVVLYDGTGTPIGILQNAPALGEGADVAMPGGGAKLIVDAGVTPGSLIQIGTDGKGEAAVGSNTVLAFADAIGYTSAANDVIPVFVVLSHAADALETVTDVTVTTAQVLALYTTPIQLLAAAPAGKAHVIDSVEFLLDFATTAYDGVAEGEDLVIKYATAGVIATVETTGFLDATADARRMITPHGVSINFGPAQAVQIALLTGNIATGDSPLKVRVRSHLVTALT